MSYQDTLFILFFFVMTGQLCISTAWMQNTALLSQLQLLLSGLAILFAYVIFRKQLKISKDQISLSRRQFEVDCIRYKLDIAIQRQLELKTNATNIDSKLNTHNLNELEITTLNWLLNENKIWFDNTQKIIDILTIEYNECLSKNPNQFKIN